MLKRIPVIVLSSSQNPEDIAKAYDLHANCYLTKPANFEAFIAVVQALEYFWIRTANLPSIPDTRLSFVAASFIRDGTGARPLRAGMRPRQDSSPSPSSSPIKGEEIFCTLYILVVVGDGLRAVPYCICSRIRFSPSSPLEVSHFQNMRHITVSSKSRHSNFFVENFPNHMKFN